MKPFLALFITLTWACQSPNDQNGDHAQEDFDLHSEDSLLLPDDFIDFYQQFHDDSTFQMAHIMFPLAGLPANVDTLKSDPQAFRWQSAEWKIHRPFDKSLTGYTKTFRKFEDGIIIENIAQKQVGVGMERRFAKLDDEWMLIYYAGMNHLK